MVQNINKKENSTTEILIISAKLLSICAFIAVLVATVNFLTADRIALNQKQKTAVALTDIYSENGMFFTVNTDGAYAVADRNGEIIGTCETVETALLEDIDAVYVIKKSDGSVFGYCVEASPMGFKDEIGMLVAVNPDGSAKGVQIISLSDTKGIGDKVKSESFLYKFVNKLPGFSANSTEFDDLVISGATRTSEPAARAVDTALKQIEIVAGGVSDEH